ncbi:hypothetical protein Cpir12675_004747 [Ceratocystis pirilliformis]|uniref:YMC020W-like alpha/beta hydrolase domain-containing protein n=1 Tax=Ceratocystis pirilliformis TaxID=259994 RepID=A0ABR3YUL3_9PEZI
MVKAQAPPTTQPRAAPKPIESQNPPTNTKDSGESSKTSNNSSMTAPGPVDTLPRRVAKRPSWYGSWPRKSATSTKVVCETIRGDTFQPLESSSSANLTRLDAVIKRAASIQSINVTETHTETHTDSRLLQQQLQQNNSRPSSLQEQPDPPLSASSISTREQNPQMTATASQTTTIETQTPLPLAPPLAETDPELAIVPASSTSQQGTAKKTSTNLPFQNVESPEAVQLEEPREEPPGDLPQPPSGWLSWLVRPAAPIETPKMTGAHEPTQETLGHAVPTQDPEPASHEPQTEDSYNSPPSPQSKPNAPVSYNSSSWLGYWYGGFRAAAAEDSSNEASGSTQNPAPETSQQENQQESRLEPQEDTPMSGAALSNDTSQSLVTGFQEPSKPSTSVTWAFWSRQPRASGTHQATVQPQQGELAVMGEASEASPTPALEVDAPTKPKNKTTKQSFALGAAAEALPLPMLPSEDKKQRHGGLGDSLSASFSSSPSKSTVTTGPTGRSLKSQSESNLRRQDGLVGSLDSTSSDTAAPCEATANPNLLLPSFNSTYSIKEPPSLISQITNLILRSHKHPPTKHVFRSINPPARPVLKAISIGVHGLFPAAYLRPMVGQPTGTSLRFATLGAEAIARWTAAHGFADCYIEKVALEGEGKIAERVESLWKLLLNWLDQLKEADLILISCHSQGVPVGIMLLARLLDLGVITSTTHISVCAMAGVCLGPFPDYKSSMGMLMGSAGELWEFSNPESDISQRLEAALRSVLQFGARITFVGSIDDQLVPLESAVYSPAQHPHIYRAVFIDGRLHAPDFIAHLVGFALKLRNLGISDHGLIRELSVPLAGSLYSGEGHSRLYYDARVYDLALANALETTSVEPGTSCSIGPRGSLAPTNPYTLPWVMRGLLEEDLVKTSLAEETRVLLQQFQAWNPTTKALKDVKYRLDAVRSRL